MTNFLAPFFNTDNETDGFGGVTELSSTREPVAATIGGVTYVYVPGYNDAGMEIFTMDGDGVLTLFDTIEDEANSELRFPQQLEMLDTDNGFFLISAGYYGYTVYSIDPVDGSLTVEDAVSDNASNFFTNTIGVNSVEINGSIYTYMASTDDDALHVFEFNTASGVLTEIDTIFNSDDPAYLLNGIRNTHIQQVGNKTYLFAAGNIDDGISVFQIGNDGMLTNVDNVKDEGTLELNGVFGMATAVVDGETYLYAAGFDDYGISVFDVANNGTLTNVADYNFGSSPYVGLYGPQDIKVLTFEGANFLFVNAYYGSGVVAFSIENDGTLVEIGRIVDTDVLELDYSIFTNFITVNGDTFMMNTGDRDNGISVFEIGGDDDVLGGTNGDDKIFGFDGDDDLSGKKGDDELFGGSGQDTLLGRAGADLLRGGTGGDIIIGGSGIDTADFTGSTSAVDVDLSAGTASGGAAEGDILLQIENLIGGSSGDTLTGDDGANEIWGGRGADDLNGGGALDTLYGGDGNDTAYGGSGFDKVQGDAGDDTLFGGSGNDKVLGDDGDDELHGDNGADIIKGRGDKDTLYGGGGDDTLDGGSDKDFITGGTGDDTITTGGAKDFVIMVDGDGADTITDFEDGKDRIDLSGYAGISGFDDINSFEVGDNLIVFLDGSDSITLEEFSQGELDASDFIF